jgi:hypothetical protein
MTALKIIGKPTAAAQAALEPHIARLYASPGASVMAIIEMRHVERLQPAPGSDKAASVGMKLVGCEIPGREQEGAVREPARGRRTGTWAWIRDSTGHESLGESS